MKAVATGSATVCVCVCVCDIQVLVTSLSEAGAYNIGISYLSQEVQIQYNHNVL